MSVYVPTHPRFNMSFDAHEVVVHLDSSYLFRPQSARVHVEEILETADVPFDFYVPEKRTGQDLPALAKDFEFMGCPRAVTEQSGRIGLGNIGPKVRAIVKHARFPVLIPSMTFKPWNSVAIFFGGSPLGAQAVELGLAVAREANVPFAVYTQLEKTDRSHCEQTLADANLLDRVRGPSGRWELFDEGTLEENLWAVPHDSLVVIGAAGQRLIRELVLGSHLEKVQSVLPNPLLVVGPFWGSSF